MTSSISAKNPDLSIDEINENDTTMMIGSLSDKHLGGGGSNQNLGGTSGEVVVSATSDIIVKSFETYILLLNLLRTQSFEIFTGLVKVFEFYVSLGEIENSNNSYRYMQ